MKPRVFIATDISKVAPEVLKEIEKECELEIFPYDRTIEKSELLEKVRDKEGLLVRVTNRVDKEVIEAGKNLRIIASYSAGFSHIDIETATARGIFVTNTPSLEVANAVAEATWALLLAVSRRVVEGDNDVRSGRFIGCGLDDYMGSDVCGKTLGIVGLGRIGKLVAQRAQGWDLKLLYADEIPADPEAERELRVQRVPLETLLSESDFITLHCPLIPGKTYHLIGEKELSLMKSSAFIVNMARGPIIDEEVLVKFLREKRIAGAALDVFENEPHLTPGLIDLKNVVLTPHLGSVTPRARIAGAVMATKNLLAGARGEIPPNVVNRELIKGQA